MKHSPVLLPQHCCLCIALPILLGSVAGCGDPTSNISYDEALESVRAIVVSGEGEGLVTEIIEISTNFPLGIPVEDAAPELATWFETEIPCSSVSLEGTTITVDFGSPGSSCTYNEHPYAGSVSIVVVNTNDNAVQVTHAWTSLSDGVITLDGTAEVTWAGSGAGHTRHVIHQLSWTREDGSSVQVSGDRLQALQIASEGLAGGVVVNGTRDWNYGGENWHLAIDDIEIIGVDPIPEDGAYTLLTPWNKQFDITFERNDDEDDTIRVAVHGNIDTYYINVSRSGEILD